MALKISDVSDREIAAFLTRIDQMPGSKTDGRIDSREAAAAARRMQSDPIYNAEAAQVLGLVPKNGAELARFAKNPPRVAAEAGILSQTVTAGSAEMGARGRGKAIALGTSPRGNAIGFTTSGRVTVDGKIARSTDQLGRALMDAARLSKSLEKSKPNNVATRRIFSALSDALSTAVKGRRSLRKERLFAGSMTLLLSLLRTVNARTQPKLRKAIVDRYMQGLLQQKDIELKMFYFAALMPHRGKLDTAQKVALTRLDAAVLPKAPPVEEYTKNRTKTLEVRHMIHEEFWKDENKYYSRRNGWKLVSKNRKDDRRVYERVYKDPNGIKKDMKMRVVVAKGELDFLDDMADPKVHTIIYSGHSSLGGNGSQAIDDSYKARGLPKTVFIGNCRGKDNYAEFMNKFPKAMLIGTDGPTYSDYQHRRITALYDMMGQGKSSEWMQKRIHFRMWDEPADNYIFPHELRKLFFTDIDGDGRMDRSPLGEDPLFNVDARKRAIEFTRAINFANSEYYYHYDVDRENGKRSTFGKEYADSVVAAGEIWDPKPGEVVRVKPRRGKDHRGKTKKFFEVQYNPRELKGGRDAYAGIVMANTAMAIAKDKFGKLEQFEVFRAILMGAQACHYLDVYTNTSPVTYKNYFEYVGLGAIKEKDIEDIFNKHDTHANNEQTKAFMAMLEKKYSLDTKKFVPKSGRRNAHVA